jgi:hypothetical protein
VSDTSPPTFRGNLLHASSGSTSNPSKNEGVSKTLKSSQSVFERYRWTSTDYKTYYVSLKLNVDFLNPSARGMTASVV